MKNKLLLFFIIIFSLSITVFGQNNGDEKSSVVSVPENVMQEVVRRILIYQFKPLTKKKVIFIAKKEIKREWLPKIQNVEFHLLTDEEVEDSGNDVYFFTEPELSKRTYEIGFAYDDPNCEYIGDTWRFRISKNRIRLWLTNGGIGGGCGSSSSFGEFSKPGN